MKASTAAGAKATSARHLISKEDFEAVTRTVRSANAGLGPEVAERIVDQAIAFVATCARFPGRQLRPSRVVDEGWHALILHTCVYVRLCDGLGTYVHHQPEAPDANRHRPVALVRTKASLRDAGFTVDEALWTAPEDGGIRVAAECEHSGGSGGCSGSCIDPQPNGSGGTRTTG